MDVKAVEALGIDPAKVLYYRRTQPSDSPKQEYYWTSDYWEVLKGLQTEISGENRDTSVVLCTTLAELSSDSNVIKDINDDNGIPVRRTDLGNYDQDRTLFKITPKK